jgi:hypothetical protein
MSTKPLPDRALTYVNGLRRELGRKPLQKLPKGEIGEAESCPIANALPGVVEVDVDCIQFYEPDPDGLLGNSPGKKRKPPRHVRQFIEEFDSGTYPELERKPKVIR